MTNRQRETDTMSEISEEDIAWFNEIRTGTHGDVTLHSGMAAVRLERIATALAAMRAASPDQTNGLLREALETLRKLSREATKGLWFTDSEDCETGHGNVMTLAIFAEERLSFGKPARLFDAINSDAMEVDCDDDEDAPRLYDRTSFANAEFVVACVNFVRTALASTPTARIEESEPEIEPEIEPVAWRWSYTLD